MATEPLQGAPTIFGFGLFWVWCGSGVGLVPLSVLVLILVLGELFLSVPSSTAVVATTAVAAADLPALERELAELLVKALSLELSAADIEPTASLFGEGLGLDSIDILEVALEVSQRYGFQLRSDDDDNQTIFLNLRSLAAHVAQHRNK